LNCFNLADLSCGEALYDGADPGREPVPDAMLNFHKRLHDNKLGEALFAQVDAVLQSKGFTRSIAAPSWIPPSSALPAPPRTLTRRVTPKCTKRARASHGISA